MNHSLRIELLAREGAIIRILGLMERRGFLIDSVQVASAQDERQTMNVTASSDRPGDLLKRQLERLHDVIAVELKPAEVVWAQSARNGR